VTEAENSSLSMDEKKLVNLEKNALPSHYDD
jgi:hypothetical protein